MLKRVNFTGVVICLSIFLIPAVYARNYVRPLVKNLLAIGYPITKEDVVALDKIAMRFNSRNRLDVLKQILSDREKIHSIENADYFEKTEAICSALRLLDEHNLPEIETLIASFSRETSWEKREKERLSYMAAKRDIDYAANVAYLLTALTQYSGNAEMLAKVEISVEILDLCNCLSYLSDIFNHTGDVHVLTALFHYASQSYGYPGEYVSRLLVDMFLQQPKIFVATLAATNEQTKKTLINEMVFGIWNNQQKGNVLESIHNELSLENDSEKNMVAALVKKINRKFETRSTGAKEAPHEKND